MIYLKLTDQYKISGIYINHDYSKDATTNFDADISNNSNNFISVFVEVKRLFILIYLNRGSNVK